MCVFKEITLILHTYTKNIQIRQKNRATYSLDDMSTEKNRD